MKTIIALFATAIISLNAAAAPAADMMYRASVSLSAVKKHYDESGNLLATSKYVSDAALPLPVVKKLMKKCPDHQIRLVREFEAEGNTTYIITLENETGYKVVRCAGSSYTVLQSFDKY